MCIILLSKVYLSASQHQEYNFPQQVPVCASVGNFQEHGMLLDITLLGPALKLNLTNLQLYSLNTDSRVTFFLIFSFFLRMRNNSSKS